MITDGLDGFIARRFKMSSKLGVFLDPLMDKFFVLFIVIIFILEGKLTYPAVMALMSRDFAVALFGIYLASSGRLWNYRFRSIWCGKATTALQFIVLMLLNFGVAIPIWLYGAFIGLGGLALVELYLPTATQIYAKLD
jgi:phosphatidylglycerophosphate synthase